MKSPIGEEFINYKESVHNLTQKQIGRIGKSKFNKSQGSHIKRLVLSHDFSKSIGFDDEPQKTLETQSNAHKSLMQQNDSVSSS